MVYKFPNFWTFLETTSKNIDKFQNGRTRIWNMLTFSHVNQITSQTWLSKQSKNTHQWMGNIMGKCLIWCVFLSKSFEVLGLPTQSQVTRLFTNFRRNHAVMILTFIARINFLTSLILYLPWTIKTKYTHWLCISTWMTVAYQKSNTISRAL